VGNREDQGTYTVAYEIPGKGRVIVGAVDYWMTDALSYRNPELVNMNPPYTLLKGVRAALPALISQGFKFVKLSDYNLK